MNENWQKKFNRDNRVKLEEVLVGASALVLALGVWYITYDYLKLKKQYDEPPRMYHTNNIGVKR